MNDPEKTVLEEKYEVTLNNMYNALYKIINMSKEQKEYIEEENLMNSYENLCASAKELRKEIDAIMGAIYELLPLYNGEKVVEKKVMELEEKYFNFIKELCMKIPEWEII